MTAALTFLREALTFLREALDFLSEAFAFLAIMAFAGGVWVWLATISGAA